MAVLCNNVIAGASIADDAADDDYQIEKSLKFSEDLTTSLSKKPSHQGNRRQWTWSAWIKLGKLLDDGYLWSAREDNNNRLYLKYNSDGTLYGYTGNSNNKQFQTERKLRDPSAWYHIVWTWDSPNALEADRCRVWINGELTQNKYPSYTQNFAGAINDNIDHAMCKELLVREQESTYFDGLMADVHFIDGLALSCAAFGKWDSSDNWIAKKFSIPTPNDGTNWSNLGGGIEDTNYEWEKCFTGANNPGDGIPNTRASSGNQITWVPDKDITADHEILISLWSSFPNGEIPDDDCLIINGENHGHRARDGMVHNTWKYYSVPGRKIDSTNGIVLKNKSANNIYQIDHIVVDGVVLQDDVINSSTRNNPNDGTKWSDYFTATTAWYSNAYLPQYAFDGIIGDGTLAYNGSETAHGSYAEFKPPYTITANDQIGLWLKLKNGNSASGEYDVKINGTSILSSLIAQGHGDWQYYTIASKTIDSTNGLYIGAEGPNHWCNLRGIVVDGHVLVDETIDNSFHLKFNEISKDRYLGLDKLTGKLEDATGATPLLATTDDYGLTLGSGNATDSFSSDLKFAFAGNNVTGGSLDISGSSHSCTVTNATLVTDQSHFYGSSINFGGDAKITTPTHSDFDLGTTNWTVEFWSRPSESSNQSALVSMGDDGSSSNGILIGYQTGDELFCYGANTGAWNLFSAAKLGAERVGVWSHYAITRQGSTFRFFNNGVLTDTKTHAGDVGQNVNAFTIGVGQTGAVGANGYIHGNIQDFRYYNHGSDAPKYTAAFTVPKRNDLVVHRLNAAVTTSDTTTNTIKNWRCYKNYSGTSNYAVDYKIQWSNDGGTWTDAVSGNLASGSAGCGWVEGDSAYTGSQTAKFWKLKVESVTSNHAPRASKIELKKDDDSWVRLVTWGGNESCDDSGEYYWHDTEYVWTGNGSGIVAGNIAASLTDTPTNYGTDSGGGTVRGNYCSWNPLMIGDSTTQSFTQGNLEWKNDGADAWTGGTLGVRGGSSDTDKWYWEVEVKHGKGGYGICNYNNKDLDHTSWGGGTDRARIYLSSNGKLSNPAGGSDLTYGSNTTCVVGDIVGVALDLSPGGSNGKITFYKNGTSLGVAHTDIDTTRYWTPFANDYGENPVGGVLNAGQRPFKHTPPTDHKCLCTGNFEDTFSGSEVNNPSKYFDVKCWMGTSGTERDIKGYNFGPDLVLIKRRDDNVDYAWCDQILGSGNILSPSEAYYPSQFTAGSSESAFGSIKTFNSDGFTLQTGNSSDAKVNLSTKDYVGWAWDAGTAASGANTDGTINVDSGNQWVNATAGFSITKFEGTEAAATVGHGLGAVPELIIVKSLEEQISWAVYHKDLGNGHALALDTNSTATDSDAFWNDTTPTNAVFSVKSASRTNGPSKDMIAYCFTPIPGYSAFGVFDGTGAYNKGPFQYCGFRPKMVIRKGLTEDGYWGIFDSERESHPEQGQTAEFNPINQQLYLDVSNLEGADASNWPFDFLSNGFMIRGDGHQYTNKSGNKYIWMAWAEHPFKTSRAI